MASISNELSRKAREIQIDNLLKEIYGYVNVNSYGGAVGDGATDDTDAFQDSIDYALSQGLTEIYLKGGSTYLISGILTNTSTITFIGDSVTISGTTLISAFAISGAANAGADIATLQSDVSTLQSDVSTAQADILTNTSNINTNASNITANSSNIEGLFINQLYGSRW